MRIMRKITKESIKAFYNREPFEKSNMVIENKEGKTYLKLFGNIIAMLDEVNELFITTADYNTRTTRERLNGLSGVRLGTKKGKLYLNNIPWNGKLTNIKDYESI